MTFLPSRFFPAACAALVLAVAARAEPAIIAKARAYVGTEAALNSLKSIHFVGTITVTNSADPGSAPHAAVDIIFQKPLQYRIQSTTDKNIEITALDGYDGWLRKQDAADPTKWEQQVLGPEIIRRLQANAYESLYFYRGLGASAAKIEEQGNISVDGVDCIKIALLYGPNIAFYRFFDKNTGRLVFTETDTGSTIREKGEMKEGGVHFPKTLITTSRTNTGATQTVTIEFESIKINEPHPDSLFRVPSLIGK